MSDIVFGGWSDIWRTDLGYASVRSPDIRPPPQTISYTSRLCVHCKKVGCHHRSLCPVKFGRPALPNSTNTPATPAQKAESASKTSTTTEPANLITEREAVRMQTATAQVANPRRLESTITARILFDSGSYRTYITDRH